MKKKFLNFGFVPLSLSAVLAVVSCQSQSSSDDKITKKLDKIANESTFNVDNTKKYLASDIVANQIIWNQKSDNPGVEVTFSNLNPDDENGRLGFNATFKEKNISKTIEIKNNDPKAIQGFKTKTEILDDIVKKATFSVLDMKKYLASDIVANQIIWNQKSDNPGVEVTFSNLNPDDENGRLGFIATFKENENVKILEIKNNDPKAIQGFKTKTEILDDIIKNSTFSVLDMKKYLASDIVADQIIWNQKSDNPGVEVTFSNLNPNNENGKLGFIATFKENKIVKILEVKIDDPKAIIGFYTSREMLDWVSKNSSFQVENKENWSRNVKESEIKWIKEEKTKKINVKFSNFKTNDDEGILSFDVMFSIQGSTITPITINYSINGFWTYKKMLDSLISNLSLVPNPSCGYPDTWGNDWKIQDVVSVNNWEKKWGIELKDINFIFLNSTRDTNKESVSCLLSLKYKSYESKSRKFIVNWSKTAVSVPRIDKKIFGFKESALDELVNVSSEFLVNTKHKWLLGDLSYFTSQNQISKYSFEREDLKDENYKNIRVNVWLKPHTIYNTFGILNLMETKFSFVIENFENMPPKELTLVGKTLWNYFIKQLSYVPLGKSKPDDYWYLSGTFVNGSDKQKMDEILSLLSWQSVAPMSGGELRTLSSTSWEGYVSSESFEKNDPDSINKQKKYFFPDESKLWNQCTWMNFNNLAESATNLLSFFGFFSNLNYVQHLSLIYKIKLELLSTEGYTRYYKLTFAPWTWSLKLNKTEPLFQDDYIFEYGASPMWEKGSYQFLCGITDQGRNK